MSDCDCVRLENLHSKKLRHGNKNCHQLEGHMLQTYQVACVVNEQLTFKLIHKLYIASRLTPPHSSMNNLDPRLTRHVLIITMTTLSPSDVKKPVSPDLIWLVFIE